MNSAFLLLLAVTALLAGGALAWNTMTQPEPRRVSVRRLGSRDNVARR